MIITDYVLLIVIHYYFACNSLICWYVVVAMVEFLIELNASIPGSSMVMMILIVVLIRNCVFVVRVHSLKSA